jgi:hypothetical protein
MSHDLQVRTTRVVDLSVLLQRAQIVVSEIVGILPPALTMSQVTQGVEATPSPSNVGSCERLYYIRFSGAVPLIL